MLLLILLNVVCALRLPPPPPLVRTHIVDAADGSNNWVRVMDQLKDVFPEMVFETKKENIGDLPEGVTFSFPYSTISVEGKPPIGLNYPLEYKYAYRWLRDAPHGHFSLYENVSVIDSWLWENPLVVQILSGEKPRVSSVRRLPEVTFAWSFMNHTVNDNTFIVRGLDGVIRQKNNLRSYELLHYLLPPIIPEWMLHTNEGNAIYKEFAKREISIVCDDDLNPQWLSLIEQFPQTAFVQQRSNETNVTIVPSVWFRRRSVEFMIPSVGHDVEPWLKGIRNHTTEPWHRPSAAPSVAHSTLVDVTGDTFWSWIRDNDAVVLYLYNGVSDCDIERFYEPLYDMNIMLGQLDLATNDHESFPLRAKAGDVLEYKNGILTKSNICSKFELPQGHVEL